MKTTFLTPRKLFALIFKYAIKRNWKLKFVFKMRIGQQKTIFIDELNNLLKETFTHKNK